MDSLVGVPSSDCLCDQLHGSAFPVRQTSSDSDFEECMQLLLGAQPDPQEAYPEAVAPLQATHSQTSVTMGPVDGHECEEGHANNSNVGYIVMDTSNEGESPPESPLGPRSNSNTSLNWRQTATAQPATDEDNKNFLAWPWANGSPLQTAVGSSNARDILRSPFATGTTPGSMLGNPMDYGSPESSHWCGSQSCDRLADYSSPGGSPPYGSSSSMLLDTLNTLDSVDPDRSGMLVPAGGHSLLDKAISHSDALSAQHVFSAAVEAGVDPNLAWHLCTRCQHLHVESGHMVKVLKYCLQDADAAAAALAVGSGCVSWGDSCMSVDRVGNAIDCPSIFVCDRPDSSVAPDNDTFRKLAKDAYQLSCTKQQAAYACRANGDWAGYASLAAEASDATAECNSYNAHAFSVAYSKSNRLFNVWHTNLCGLCVDDARDKFVEQLECLISLDHPGGVLLSVVTGASVGNDSIEEVLQVEKILLQVLQDKGGFVEGESCRASRLGNIVVTLVHTQQEEPSQGGGNSSASSTANDPAVANSLAAALEAAAREAATHLEAAHIFTQVADQLRQDRNCTGYTDFLGRARVETSKAQAALGKKRKLMYALHNNTANTWRIDLHGQSVRSAMQRVTSQMELLQALHHPGALKFEVITGKGNGSKGGVPVIRNAVLRWLHAISGKQCENSGTCRPITWQFAEGNAGMVVVNMSGVDGLTTDIGDLLE